MKTLAVVAALAATVAIGSAVAQAPAPDAVRKAFADADANRDGALNIDEYIANVVYVFKQADTNRDGALTEAEVRAYAVNYRPEVFKSADRNGDGKLSVGEAVATKVIDYFEIDSNRDGVLSIEEVLVYERALPAAGARK